MARTHRVNNSRKEHTCSKGGHVIPVGDPYLWAKPGFRRRTPIIRCVNHPFRPSELTTSLASEPMAAVEAFEDAASQGFESIEDLQSAWDELLSAVEEYRDTRQEALDAWENGNSTLEEFVDTAENAVGEVEDFTPEEFDDEEPQRDDYKDTPKGQDKFDAAWEEWDEARQSHIEEQTDEALNVALSLEF